MNIPIKFKNELGHRLREFKEHIKNHEVVTTQKKIAPYFRENLQDFIKKNLEEMQYTVKDLEKYSDVTCKDIKEGVIDIQNIINQDDGIYKSINFIKRNISTQILVENFVCTKYFYPQIEEIKKSILSYWFEQEHTKQMEESYKELEKIEKNIQEYNELVKKFIEREFIEFAKDELIKNYPILLDYNFPPYTPYSVGRNGWCTLHSYNYYDT